MDRVGVTPMDLRHFPRYTLGLLVKDNNVVGGISGAAPPGAAGQVALSPIDAAGGPILSGQLTLPNGNPARGVLRVLFVTGNRSGN